MRAGICRHVLAVPEPLDKLGGRRARGSGRTWSRSQGASLGPLAPGFRRDAGDGLELTTSERLEHDGFRLDDIPELLAGRVLQVRLVADDDDVRALRRDGREQFPQGFG